GPVPLTNGELAELLARTAEEEAPGTNRHRALIRASRAALFWPEEAFALLQADRPLLELRAVGPWLAGVMGSWLTAEEPPVVLGPFHSKLRLREDQTERYLAALRNPDFHVLAHPRGRRWGVREGLRADWPRVFAEAAKQGKALEIDAHPDRQDLDVELLELAR